MNQHTHNSPMGNGQQDTCAFCGVANGDLSTYPQPGAQATQGGDLTSIVLACDDCAALYNLS